MRTTHQLMADITKVVNKYVLLRKMRCFTRTDTNILIAKFANRFAANFTQWNTFDEERYLKVLTEFVTFEIAKELWLNFGTIPMDPEAERIEEEWNGFPAGTFREDIWKWFEETFGVSVAEDLMGL